jgi:glycolate oxidase iron-sulfur subunit
MQPEAAGKLGRRKAANLAATGATAIAAANPGCALQIAAYLTDPVPVYHPMSLLDASIRGVQP